MSLYQGCHINECHTNEVRLYSTLNSLSVGPRNGIGGMLDELSRSTQLAEDPTVVFQEPIEQEVSVELCYGP